MFPTYYLTQQEYAQYVQSTTTLPVYSVQPQLFIRYGRLKQPLIVPLDDLLTDTETTTADEQTSLTTVKLVNADGFSVGDFILLGAYGNETSEIVSITALVANSATVVAKFLHPTGTLISRLAFNQVEISNAPNVGVTKTVMGTVNLEADNDTLFIPTLEGGLYYARYYNSFSQNFSDYSDALPYLGFNKNMCRAIIDNALLGINKEVNATLTDEYGYVELNNCLEEVQRASKRYSFYQVNRHAIKAEPGRMTYNAPNNIDNSQILYMEYSNPNLGSTNNYYGGWTGMGNGNDWNRNGWAGAGNGALQYLDNRDFDSMMPSRTKITEPLSIGAGVVKVLNSNDFPSRVDFTPSAPIILSIGGTGATSYTYLLEVNTSRGWSRMAGNQITNGFATLTPFIYNNISWSEMPNATEYRLYRSEGGTSQGLIYQGAYVTSFNDTNNKATTAIDTQQAIGTVFVGGVGLPYIENENNIFTLQYPSPVSAEYGADVTVERDVGYPYYFTYYLEDNTLAVYPAPNSERNFYLTYYTTNEYLDKDQDTIPFPNTMIVVYYLQWKFLTRQNNGIETEDSMAKKSQYDKQLYLLRTKDNNGVTKLTPRVRNWKN